MLAASVIIFREMLEMVLIVGIVLAATRSLPGRLRWILGGFAGGLTGAAVVAIFTDAISSFAEGMGQELFNAGVLFAAAFFIGWTVLWMARHAREMKMQFTRLGDSIKLGTLPFYSLSIAIALAIWREGSEIVLFSYGMIAAGQSLADLALGALLGGSAGLVVGLLIYFGLISLPARHFLRVTSAILILLVAGMMSQGINFLISGGFVEWGTATLWDSSRLLSEQSVTGQMLHVLIGYTAQPAQLQVLVYAATAGLLFWLVRSRPQASNGSGNLPENTVNV